jgi:catechol 2,3-dioxygenase-like lactoylglutathione lyase family enzyme
VLTLPLVNAQNEEQEVRMHILKLLAGKLSAGLSLVAALCVSASLLGPAHAAESTPLQQVQAALSRPVVITCKLDESIAFYRDVLNQSVLDDSVRDGARVSQYVDMPKTAKARLVIMGPLGVVPSNEGNGHFGFIGVEDPNADACKTPTATEGTKPARAWAGDVLFSVRVVNLDEIAARAKKRGTPILIAPGTSGSGKARNMMMQDPNGRIVEAFEVMAK